MRLILGDSWWLSPPVESVDALVCDPPAGISFMGKAFDSDRGGRDEWIEWLTGVMQLVYMVLKPGAHGLVWALPRTSHWTATALENAGFEIRDIVSHIFGSGFPKSLNLPDGIGTALKPAAEHWILVRKPLAGTVAANVLEHGTGGINVDACRVEGVPPSVPQPNFSRDMVAGFGASNGRVGEMSQASGRWPPHLLLSHSPDCADRCVEGCPVRVMDEQSGATQDNRGPTMQPRPTSDDGTASWSKGDHLAFHIGDSGGASRFFPRFRYQPKPSRAEREAGCEHLPARSGAEAVDREEGSAGMDNPRAGAGRTASEIHNHHPTLKSLDLMRWLVRLITPPGGVVLDPFMGSGTTGCACACEGFGFVGIEQDPEYIQIARARIEYYSAARHEVENDDRPRPSGGRTGELW